MIDAWVIWTLLAISMQSIRTAGQKHLSNDVSAVAATFVRYLYGLPFALCYLFILWGDDVTVGFTPAFFVPALLAGLFQVVATFMLIRLFMLRNFAVGSAYIRGEILMTAIIGAVFFADAVSTLGWFAIALCFVGLLLISLSKTGGLSGLWNRSAAYGLGAGLGFSLTSLLIRSASLSLQADPVLAAAVTLSFMICIQTLISLVWVCVHNVSEIATVFRKWRVCLFVGVTSVVGSAGWFTAFTLERAAYVKTLGQLELLITLMISILFFKETPKPIEYAGMAALVLGVVVLLLST